MPMSKSFKRAILAISVALVVVVFLGGFVSERRLARTQSDGAYRQMGVYEEVLHKIQSDYVTEPNIGNVTTGALHGLLESLDAIRAISPRRVTAYKAHQHEGTAQVGLDVSKRFGYATVVSVIPGSPARREQIQRRRHHRVHRRPVYARNVAGNDSPAAGGQARHRCDFSSGASGGKPEPDKITLTRTAIAAPAMGEQQYENSSILYLKPVVLTRSG